MDNKKFMYFFIGFMALVFITGITYLVISFTGKGNKDNNVNTFQAFSEDKKLYTNKKKAYDDLAEDSVVKVREENVRVDLASVFGQKKTKKEVNNQELIAADNNTNIVKETTPMPQSQTAVAPFQKNTKQVTTRQTTRNVTVSEPKQGNAQPSQTSQVNNNSTSSQRSQPTKKRDTFFSAFAENQAKTNNSSSQNEDKTQEKTQFVQAVIHGQQEVSQGATVKLRTVSSATIDGNKIPVNSYIYGIASITEERVTITINALSLSDQIIPVRYSVYDKDGIEGIYIPGLTQHEATTEAVDQAINEAQKLNVPYLSSIPINIIRKKNNELSAILTDGYRVILK